MDVIGPLLPIILLALGLAFLWTVRRISGGNYLRRRPSAGWPLVGGRVESFEVKNLGRGIFYAKLYYSYCAQGHFHSGEFTTPCQPSLEATDPAGQRWRDRQIMVRYNPSDPSHSVFIQQGN